MVPKGFSLDLKESMVPVGFFFVVSRRPYFHRALSLGFKESMFQRALSLGFKEFILPEGAFFGF